MLVAESTIERTELTVRRIQCEEASASGARRMPPLTGG
jgi:hypothetical protein